MHKVKKLIYKSYYRGTKEADLLLYNFAKNNLLKMSDSQLKIYENLLNCSDIEIQNWVSNLEKVPEIFISIINDIRNYSLKLYLKF